jgi:hypothetical protein
MPENKARTADRVKGKNVHGRIVVLTRSKPEQLGLFQTFLPELVSHKFAHVGHGGVHQRESRGQP